MLLLLKDLAGDCVRVDRLLYFGRVFLCGLDPPVLKLQLIAPALPEYVSVVEQNRTEAAAAAVVSAAAAADAAADDAADADPLVSPDRIVLFLFFLFHFSSEKEREIHLLQRGSGVDGKKNSVKKTSKKTQCN